jgi:hypothetical protein
MPPPRVLVQTHPTRLKRASRLARQLNGHVIIDPEPEAGANPWRTYAACVHAAETQGWTLIIQDDAVPHPQLLPACQRIMARYPADVVCLWHAAYPQVDAMRLAIAHDKGLAYAQLRASRFVPAVALLWPPHQINRLRRWLPEKPCAADDEMISRFLAQPKYHDRYLVTIPSLVEHDDTLPSLMGTDWGGTRTALYPPPVDLSSVDWESDALPHL